MMSGVIGGTLSGLVVWLVVSSFQPGGLADFMKSTGACFLSLPPVSFLLPKRYNIIL